MRKLVWIHGGRKRITLVLSLTRLIYSINFVEEASRAGNDNFLFY
jgi:hypothetical protein